MEILFRLTEQEKKFCNLIDAVLRDDAAIVQHLNENGMVANPTKNRCYDVKHLNRRYAAIHASVEAEKQKARLEKKKELAAMGITSKRVALPPNVVKIQFFFGDGTTQEIALA